jgi:integrase
MVKKSRTSYQRLERNIYIDQRNGAFRFRVAVHPFPTETRTFDREADGKVWALRTRADLTERKHSVAEASTPQAGAVSDSSHVVMLEPVQPGVRYPGPTNIRLNTIFDHYETVALPAMADSSEATSRLRKLRVWFGDKLLVELTQKFLDGWAQTRLSGQLGSGRPPVARGAGEARRLTKDQRRRRRLKGTSMETVGPAQIHPVSSQTARHELRYLRQAVRRYFADNELMGQHAGWLLGCPLMTMALPAPSEPRDRRLNDAEFTRILRAMESRQAQYIVLLALSTGLRRSEIVSLRWDDVDMMRRIVRLRRPGYSVTENGKSKHSSTRKSKTHSRDVPLTEEAVTLLTRYGVQDSGQIFTLKPSSVTQAWTRAVDRAGLVDARLHDVRREALSRLVDDFDLPLQLVTVFSGHRDLATLQRHYLRPSAEKVASRLKGRRAASGLVVPD